MTKVCPITDQLINEKVARVIAFFTFIITVLFILFERKAIPIFALLAADFVIRGFWKGENSLLMVVSVWISEKLKFSPKPINAGPKIFAARVGTLLSVGAILLHFFGLNMASLVFAGILAFFAFLESVLNFCVACKLYPFLLKLGI